MKSLIKLSALALLFLATACSGGNQKRQQENVQLQLPAGAVEMRY